MSSVKPGAYTISNIPFGSPTSLYGEGIVIPNQDTKKIILHGYFHLSSLWGEIIWDISLHINDIIEGSDVGKTLVMVDRVGFVSHTNSFYTDTLLRNNIFEFNMNSGLSRDELLFLKNFRSLPQHAKKSREHKVRELYERIQRQRACIEDKIKSIINDKTWVWNNMEFF